MGRLDASQLYAPEWIGPQLPSHKGLWSFSPHLTFHAVGPSALGVVPSVNSLWQRRGTEIAPAASAGGLQKGFFCSGEKAAECAEVLGPPRAEESCLTLETSGGGVRSCRAVEGGVTGQTLGPCTSTDMQEVFVRWTMQIPVSLMVRAACNSYEEAEGGWL